MNTKKMYKERFGIESDPGDKIDAVCNVTYFEWRDRALYSVDKLDNNTRIELKIDGNALVMLASEASKHHYTLWRPCVRQNWTTPVPAVPAGYEFNDKGSEHLTYERMVTGAWNNQQLIECGFLVPATIPKNRSVIPPESEVIDVVKKPSHYQLIEGVEVIEIIASSMTEEAFKGYCLGNMIKYRLRCGKKDDITQEIGKADFYGELYDKHKHLCRK